MLYAGRVPDLYIFDSDPDPALFFRGFHDAKKSFFAKFFLFLTVGIFSSVFKDNYSFRIGSRNTVICLLMEGSGSGVGSSSVQIIIDPEYVCIALFFCFLYLVSVKEAQRVNFCELNYECFVYTYVLSTSLCKVLHINFIITKVINILN